ncbi:MAG TPA: hypothetical protein VIX59_04245 [Candidatus Binataceae bacterium]
MTPITPTNSFQSSQMSEKSKLIANPKYREILQRAVEIEEREAAREHWLGWEWHEVRAYPASLVKVVIAGIVKITFKSNSSTHYRLVDSKALKQALKA